MQNRLDDVYASLLARRASRGRLRRLTIPPPGVVDFSSNSYLSLQTNPDIRSAYLARLQAPSTSSGCVRGSRLLDGNSPAAEALERDVAAFHGAPAGLLFNSGFAANTGLFSCAPQPGDVVVHDELIHASVHDGIRLGGARAVAFAHNCVSSLDETLAGLVAGDAGRGIRTGQTNVFVAVESVYSMDGDVARLQEMVECVERRLPLANGHLVVDEAHATGWLGSCGRGLVSQLGLEERVFCRIHTFGKSLGCAGAIILCSPTTRWYLINYARSLIYTTALCHDSLAAVETVYAYLMTGQAEAHRRRLRLLVLHVHRLLTRLCARRRPPAHILGINPDQPESPIIPILTAHARSLAQRCQDRGFMVRPMVAPTVPAGAERGRLCVHAGNNTEEVQGLCEAIDEWVCERLAGGKTLGKVKL
ncbi:Pyridoxal phosphate-dependent transferase, major domain protein [Ophiocordyceps sinensis CO18]|uniref:Pyridoxal phosphate-dependent transferase, major domain protein n=1 Tax=Ophiocordyceps sinensis (strain Co18 / CGMCC 3.14243) TaxID=911162 RepID=T5AMC0_OPHSC|nr:Pyridoxal phosphate-dependent transferase, major domain protein [Ophiocordyceps sinensis CO18]